MRKRDILKHYKSSLKKWEEVLDNIRNNNIIDYLETYNNFCGFCDVHNKCTACPLFTKNKEDLYYCGDVYIYILELAEDEDWPEAEKLCKQFISKIKREIKKVEK